MSEGMPHATDPHGKRWPLPLAGLAALAVLAALAFRFLNPIIAAFVVIVAATLVGMSVVARDWDRHPTYEEREAARARRRSDKWARGQRARDKDRARWEAHRARQARKAAP